MRTLAYIVAGHAHLGTSAVVLALVVTLTHRAVS